MTANKKKKIESQAQVVLKEKRMETRMQGWSEGIGICYQKLR